jgi:hypothetical protein
MAARKLFRIVVTFGILLVVCKRGAQSQCSADAKRGEVAPEFRIANAAIQIPVGAFLLIRKNGEMGALRLTSVGGTSSYESYFVANSLDSFVGKRVVQHSGEINVKPLRGPGRDLWIYKPSGYKARVGKWSFGFNSPTIMDMSDASFWTGLGDHGYEFAPTSACDLSEIDTKDKRLRWFRYDPNASIVLPLADLAK